MVEQLVKKHRLSHWLACLPLLLFLAVLSIRPQPVYAALPISADSYCLYDADKKQVLWGYNLASRRPPASTTKIMTALVVRDYNDLKEKVVISPKADRTTGSGLGLKAGQVWMVDDLVKAALMRSANDACVALAEHTAGSEDLFAYLMNKKAVALGAYNTNFVNSSGLSIKNHYSTSYDLARMAAALLRDPYLALIVSSQRMRINHPSYPQGLEINNTNRLLSIYPGAKGVKTGTTNAAGMCLVAAAERNGRTLIAVVLHSNNRYADCSKLLNMGFKSTHYYRLIGNQEPYKFVWTVNGTRPKIPVLPQENIRVFVVEGGEKHIESRVTLDYRIKAPIRKGTVVGRVAVFYFGNYLQSIPLLAGENVKAIPWEARKLWYYFDRWF